MVYKNSVTQYVLICIFSTVVYGILMGIIMDSALTGIISGVVFGALFTPIIVVLCGHAEKGAIPIREGISRLRRIYCEGPANQSKGLNSIGGWMFFSDGFLEFFPLKMNFGGSNIVIPFSDIIGVRSSFNRLTVATPQYEFEFVVNKPKEWEYTIKSVLHL